MNLYESLYFILGSAHVLYKNITNFHRTVNKVKSFFRNEGIACMTFQPEFLLESSEDEARGDDVMLSFSRCADKDCETLTCCEVDNETEENSSSSISNDTRRSDSPLMSPP